MSKNFADPFQSPFQPAHKKRQNLSKRPSCSNIILADVPDLNRSIPCTPESPCGPQTEIPDHICFQKKSCLELVEDNGFEPLTPCVQGRCSSQLS